MEQGACGVGDTSPSRDHSPGGKKYSDATESIASTSTLSMTPAVGAMASDEPIKSTLMASLTHPGHLLNSISPDFLKKVEVWERLKSGLSVTPPESTSAASPTSPASGGSGGNGVHKRTHDSPEWREAALDKRRGEDKLPPAFKKKLAEWEIRKAVAGKSDQNVEELQKILPLDFNRKLQEWERMKAAGKPVSPGMVRQGQVQSWVSLAFQLFINQSIIHYFHYITGFRLDSNSNSNFQFGFIQVMFIYILTYYISLH